MSLPLYIAKIEGETQGAIKGGVTQKGRQDWIECHAYHHEVVSPRDTASGLPTGKRQHKPLVITKSLDKSSPLLMNALVNNENLKTVEFRFFRPSATGAEQHYYTIELVNANIAEIHPYVLNVKDPALTKFPDMEHVSFTYQKIIWTFVDGGITAEDDWESPVGR
jgi:type VI secretion system secreted protein Hcp